MVLSVVAAVLLVAGCGSVGYSEGTGDRQRGKELFTEKCGSCHTLANAGTKGQIGPNLDVLRPGYAQVEAKVKNGGGRMPAFRGRLSAQEIRDIAAFVATQAGSP